MKLHIVLALLALFSAHEALCHNGRRLQKSASAGNVIELEADDATVYGAGKAASKEGKAFVAVKGFAQAESKAEDDLIYFCKKVLKKDYLKKVCVPWGKYCCQQAIAFVKKDLRGTAYAVAGAYAGVVVKAYAEGDSVACGKGAADAYARAEAFVDILVKAIVAAKVGYDYEAAALLVKGKVEILAQAYASAWAKACVTEGVAKAYQESLAVAFIEVVVDVVIRIAAWDGCKSGSINKSYVDVDPTEETLAVTKGDNYVKGTGKSASGGKAYAETDFDKDFGKKCFPFC